MRGMGAAPAASQRAACAASPRRRRPAGPVLAITNARIFPVTAAAIEKGTIVIRGGRIEALGANVQVPQGATVIDAKGGHVYPGFINARTTIGIGENGVRGYDDVSEMHDWNQPLRTRVAYHSESETIPVARGTGVTTVGVAPAGGIMSGEFAVMNLDGWTWEEATLRGNCRHRLQLPGARRRRRTRRRVVAADAAAHQRRAHL